MCVIRSRSRTRAWRRERREVPVHVVQDRAVAQPRSRAARSASARSAVALDALLADERAQRPQRLDVAAGRHLDEHVGLLGGRRAPLVDDDERAALGGQAQALEQARVGRDRVGAPDDHDLGAVADVAERRGARAARLEREPGGAVERRAGGVDRRADRVRQRDGGALRLARRLPEPVDERRRRPAEDRRRLVERRVERHLAPVDAGGRRRRGRRGRRTRRRRAGTCGPGARSRRRPRRRR